RFNGFPFFFFTSYLTFMFGAIEMQREFRPCNAVLHELLNLVSPTQSYASLPSISSIKACLLAFGSSDTGRWRKSPTAKFNCYVTDSQRWTVINTSNRKLGAPHLQDFKFPSYRRDVRITN